MFIGVMGKHDSGGDLEPCVKPLSTDFSTAGLLRTFEMPSYLEISERVIRFAKLIFPMGLSSSEHPWANAELREVFRIMLSGD